MTDDENEEAEDIERFLQPEEGIEFDTEDESDTDTDEE